MNDKKSFWTTLPGMLTGIGGLITAVGGLLLILYQMGVIGHLPAGENHAPPAGSTSNPPSGQQSPSTVVCHIAGKVLDEHDNKPLANTRIDFQNPNGGAINGNLATTGVDGKFEADCSWVQQEAFPIMLVLSRPGWCRRYFYQPFIELGRRYPALNIYVSDQVMRTQGCP